MKLLQKGRPWIKVIALLFPSISKDSKKKRSGNIGVSIRALLVDCLLVTLMGRIKVGHFGYGEVLG